MLKHVDIAQRSTAAGELPNLKHIVSLSPIETSDDEGSIREYRAWIEDGQRVPVDQLRVAESRVKDGDVVNVQFTSGTTGLPKAALLSHRYVSVCSVSRYLTIHAETF